MLTGFRYLLALAIRFYMFSALAPARGRPALDGEDR